MSEIFIASFFVFIFAILFCAVLFYILVLRPRKRYELSGALDLVLYRILLPQEENPPAGETKKREPKEIMVAMEQFYSALGALRVGWLHRLRFGSPAVIFEAALPHIGEEVVFYSALPRIYAQFFASQLHSFFPSAQIEVSHDYNIFHPSGASAGAVAFLNKSPLLSLRTYNELGHDPLAAITSAFAKLKREGDGASIQIVMRPTRRPLYARGKEAARRLRSGQMLKDALGGFGREFVKSIAYKSTPQEIQQQAARPKAVDEETAKQIETKASRPAFDVTIRLVVSAQTPEECSAILQGLKAAFQQFDNPQGNELVFEKLGGRALEGLLYEFSFRLFSRAGLLYLSASELASIFHFPYAGFAQPNVQYLKAREAPPPVNLPEGGIRLGKSVYRGEERDVYITEDDRRRHVYIIGQTGTGKSALLKEMARQDIQAGRGMCFIDPHGDTIDTLMGFIPRERIEDVIYIDPGDTERPVGLNFLEYDIRYPEQKSLVVNELFDIFNKLFNMSVAGGPMFEQYFRNATMLVMEDPQSGNTLLEVGRVLADKQFRDYKLSRSSNIVVNMFWQKIAEKAGGEASLQNMVPYVTSKFDTFLANEIMRPIIAQERSTIRFREAMDSGKILLINLSKGRLGELNSALLGLIIVGKILIAALSRVDIKDEAGRRDFYLYIDEFQNVTTKSIATILSEARKYRLDLIIAHQFLGQLEDAIKKAVFGNAGSMVAFRVGSDDGEFMAKQFSPVFGERDLLNIDNYNAYVKLLIHGTTSRAFNMKTYPPAKGDLKIREDAIKFSCLTYGRSRAELEEEIRRRYHA